MRVEYDEIAHRYDTHRQGGGPYLEKLTALAASCPVSHVLEIGAGTGNITQVFLDTYPCRLTALDLSMGMLARAQAKGIPAQWLRASANEIPLANASVGFVFGVYVLHHLTSLDTVFTECARVLDRGCAAFVTASTEFIERHPMNRYFPSFAAIDTARFQPIEEIAAAFRRAGFTAVDTQRFRAEPQPIGYDYVEKVANQFVSTYALIPEAEFRAGLERLRADVTRTGWLDVAIEWESVVVWAWL